MSNHEQSRNRLRQILGQHHSSSTQPAGSAAGSEEAVQDAREIPPVTGPYRLLLRVGQAPGRSRWYARLDQDPAGSDGCSPTGPGPGAEGPGRRTARRRREEQEELVALHEAARAQRTQSERMVTVWTCPEGDPEELARRGEQWPHAVVGPVQGLRHPHLLHVHEARAEDPLSPILVTEFPEGGSLAAVLSVRERLPLAEVASVLIHLSRVLSWLHSQEVFHGAVTAEEVFFTRDSAVLLSPPCAGPWQDRRGSAAEDLRQLAVLGWSMLAGEAPGPVQHRIPLPLVCPEATRPVVTVLEEALDQPPELRPSVQELMQVFRGAVDAVPVGLHEAVHPDFAGRLPARPVQNRPAQNPSAENRPAQIRSARARSAQVRSARSKGSRPRRGQPRSIGVRVLDVLRPAGSSEAAARRATGRTGRRRTTVLAAGAMAALVLSAGTWWVVGHGGPADQSSTRAASEVRTETRTGKQSSSEPAHPSAGPTSAVGAEGPLGDAAQSGNEQSPGKPEDAVVGLFQQRDRALTEHQEGLVRTYAGADGRLLREDAALVRGLGPGQLAHLRTRLDQIHVLERTGHGATVQARMHVAGYQPQAGEEVQQDADGGTAQTIRVRMSNASGAWRVESVDALRAGS